MLKSNILVLWEKSMSDNKIGAIEIVSFPSFGIKKVLAKVDTGAYTSSIHCHSIKIFKTKEGRQLRFVPIDSKHAEQRVTKFRRLPITSSNGITVQRYAISTSIVVHVSNIQLE